MRYVTLLGRTDKAFHTRIYGDRVWEITFDLRRPVGLESRIQLVCDGRVRKVTDRNLNEALRGIGWQDMGWFTTDTTHEMFAIAWDLCLWPFGPNLVQRGGWGVRHEQTFGRTLAVLAEHLPGIEQLYLVGFTRAAIKKLFLHRHEVLTMRSGSLAERLGVPAHVIGMIQRNPEAYQPILQSVQDTGGVNELLQAMDRFPRITLVDAQSLTSFATRHHYDLDRLHEYLTVECRDYQGIMEWRDAFRYLRDYVRMAADLDDHIEKYPRSLRRSHDVVAARHRFKAKEINAERFEKVTSSEAYAALTGPVAFSGGERRYVVVAPSTVADLEFESQQLRHCVVSYAKRIAEETTRIYFLRDALDPELPLVTMQISLDGQLHQARGEQNRPCTPEERSAIAVWAQTHGLTVPQHLH